MIRQPLIIGTVCLLLAGIGDASAQPFTKNQQKCAGRLNKALTKVDAAVAKQIAGCLKNHAKGKPLSKTDPSLVTMEGCTVADEKGKIDKAEQKTFDDFDKACVGTDREGVSNYPPFAATNASSVNDAGATKAVNLSHDIFGADLDSGVLLTADVSRHAALCQQKVWRAAAKCQSTRLKEFALCAKAALKSGLVSSAEELENQCQGSVAAPQPDEKGKIAKACLGADGGIGKSVSKCDEDLDLDGLLPGCAGEAHADCVAEKVTTRVCQLINQAAGLARDCGDPTEIQYVTGLRAGGVFAPSGMSTIPNPGNLDQVSSHSGAVGGIDPSGPSAAWADLLEPDGPWQNDWTIIYTGEIHDDDGLMAFREDFDDYITLTVCGKTVIEDTNWWSETSSSVDCGSGGWHSFELRLHNAGAGAGVVFEWDPAGGTAWEIPQNSDANTADVFRTEEGVPYSGSCATESCISGFACIADVCNLSQVLGGDCTAPLTLCPGGSQCTAGTCQMEVGAGESCYAAGTVCGTGLSCNLGTCQTELSAGGDCSAADTYCAAGLVCSAGTTCQTPAGNERINVYPAVPGLAASDQYSFRVRAVGEATWLSPFAFITRSNYSGAAGHFQALDGWSKTYINFEMLGSTQVEIEISKVSGDPIESAAVHPWDAATSWSVVGGKAYLIVDEPGLFAVDIDSQMDRFHTGVGYHGAPHEQSPVQAVAIFANPMLADKPDLNAPTVHVVQPGETAPDLGSAGYESITTLAFAAGVHNIGQGFRVRANRSYYIPGDALIYGQMHTGTGYGITTSDEGLNLHIYGHGTLSGEKIPHPYAGPDPAEFAVPSPYADAASYDASGTAHLFNMLWIYGAAGAVVEGITIADAPGHHAKIWPGYAEGNEAHVKWSKLLGWRLNTDGVSAPNLRIENCYFVTQDDAIYLYDGIEVRNTVFANEANGTTFIFAPLGKWAGFSNPALVEDVVVIYNRMLWYSWAGAVFNQRVGCTGDCSSQSDGEGIFRNIRIEDRFPSSPHFVMALADGGGHWGFTGERGGPYGISGLVFEKLEAAAPSFLKNHHNIPPANFSDNNVLYGEYSDYLWGDATIGALFSNFTFEDFTEAGETVTSLDHFVTNAAVTNMTFTPAAQAATCPLGARIEVEEPASSDQWVPAVIEGGPNADGKCLTGYDDCWTDETLGWSCYGNEYDKWRTPGTYRNRPEIPSDSNYVPGLRAGAIDFSPPTGPPWSNDMSFDLNPGNLDMNTTDSRANGGVDPMGPSLAWTNRSAPWKEHWTVVYTGQIYDADGLMSFRESLDGVIWLKVGGQVLLNDDTWDNITTATVNLGSGGWFDFELRMHNDYGGAGITSNLIGFEWDRDGGTKWRRPKNFDATTADLFRTCVTDNDGDGVCD